MIIIILVSQRVCLVINPPILPPPYDHHNHIYSIYLQELKNNYGIELDYIEKAQFYNLCKLKAVEYTRLRKYKLTHDKALEIVQDIPCF